MCGSTLLNKIIGKHLFKQKYMQIKVISTVWNDKIIM